MIRLGFSRASMAVMALTHDLLKEYAGAEPNPFDCVSLAVNAFYSLISVRFLRTVFSHNRDMEGSAFDLLYTHRPTGRARRKSCLDF